MLKLQEDQQDCDEATLGIVQNDKLKKLQQAEELRKKNYSEVKVRKPD